MPNWCNNKAIFIAKTEEAQQLLAQFKEYLTNLEDPKDAKFFGWFCPMPADQEENWYQWNINHWGTKWDAPIGLDNLPVEYTIDFWEDTAWSPPVAFYDFMTDKGFYVEASYYEPGAGFVGTYNDGVDDSEDIPAGDEAFQIIKEVVAYNDYEIDLEKEADFANLNSGDVIGVNSDGNSVIYVGHKFYTWEDFEANNEDVFTSDVRTWDDSYDEICQIYADFYIVEVIEDNSKCGTVKGVMYTTDMKKIHCPVI